MIDAPTTDIAFTDAVKATQEALGSRQKMEVMARHRGFQSTITDDLARFLERVDSFYLATASADARPYIQHRGGEPGFLRIDGPTTLSIPDYPGNAQYISLGNLSENDRVFLFFMDYETKTRIKLWGRARIENLADRDARRLVFEVEAWDANCPKHIPDRFRAETVATAQEKLLARIAELETELETLRGSAQ
ncbi:MAG: pyridoxamine 5'-phosphate oxidase family protein [Pseudomonadota bacterium]